MTMNNDKQRLTNHVKELADRLEVPFEDWDTDDYPPFDEEDSYTALDYVDGALDIVYHVRGRYDVIGAELLLAYGGPNIFLDTRDKVIKGYWAGDYAEVRLGIAHESNIEAINEVLADVFSC